MFSRIIIYAFLSLLGLTLHSQVSDGLVAYYQFDGSVIDASSNGNNGIRFGTTGFPDRHGCVNGAVRFDGIDDYVTVEESTSLQLEYISITAWVKLSDLGRYSLAVKSAFDNATGEQFALSLVDNSFEFSIKRGSGCIPGEGWQRVRSRTITDYSEWIFIACTWDGSMLKMFFNGMLDSTNTSATEGPLDVCLGAPIRFGKQWSSDVMPLDGALDDIRIYNRAITHGEIQSLYNENIWESPTLRLVPGTYTSIQSALESSNSGDTILVYPGVYYENIDLLGKSVVLGSLFLLSGDTSYVSQTIIDGSSLDRVITIDSNENTLTRLSGFTVQNGLSSGVGEYPVGYGGGIFIGQNCSPRLDHLIIQNSEAQYTGGGIHSQGSPVIESVLIRSNQSSTSGGGICFNPWTWAEVLNSRIINNQSNTGGGIGISGDGNNVWLKRTLIADNHSISTGAGINFTSASQYSNLFITNSTISNNETSNSAIGGGIYTGSNLSISAENTILWGNLPAMVGQSDGAVSIEFNYSLIEGGWLGVANSDQDPLFNTDSENPYSLLATSPCINMGNPDLDADGTSWENDTDDQDPDGTRMDMGAFYFDQSNLFPQISVAPDSIDFSIDNQSGFEQSQALTISNTGTAPLDVSIVINSRSVIDIDGNNYPAVQVGNQVWMAENLRVTHYRDGTAIPNVTDPGEWTTTILGAYCIYNNNSSNEADTYGALYNWAAAADERQIAPVGWHLPSDSEWQELEMTLGMSQSEAEATGYRGTNEGSKLAGNSGLWDNGEIESDAEFGSSSFDALPGGTRSSANGEYDGLGIHGSFWTATANTSDEIWYRTLYNDRSDVWRYNVGNGIDGLAIRCLNDTDTCLISWLSIDTVSLTIPASESADVTITVNSEGLETAEYSDILTIISNDTNNRIVEIPVSLSLITSYSGPTWHVSTEGSDETGDGSEDSPFAFIQSGIDAAQDGDTVIVAEGLYEESIIINDKDITILSHYYQDPDTSIISNTIISGSDENQVVYIQDSDVMLGGVTISDGLAQRGGGIKSASNGAMIIENCVIRDNEATIMGGAIYYQGNLLIKNTLFFNNISNDRGGAIEIQSDTLQVMNSTFEGNSSTLAGGAIGSQNTVLILHNNQFVANTAYGQGGAIYKSGGGTITCIGTNTFINNQSTGSMGGALYLGGGGFHTLDSLGFRGNTAEHGGGGIQIEFGEWELKHCTFSGNTSTDLGQDIIITNGGELDLINVTILGGETLLPLISLRDESHTSIENSIIWGNTAHWVYGEEPLGPSSVNVSFSDIGGGAEGVDGNLALNWNEGNFDLDPQFREIDSLTISSASPCIDAGNPDLDGDGYVWSVDLDDQDPDGTRQDLGAYYHHHEPDLDSMGLFLLRAYSNNYTAQTYNSQENAWMDEVTIPPFETEADVLKSTYNPVNGKIYFAVLYGDILYLKSFDPITNLWENVLAPPIHGGIDNILISIDHVENQLHLVREYADFVDFYSLDLSTGAWNADNMQPPISGGVHNLALTYSQYDQKLYLFREYGGTSWLYKYATATGEWATYPTEPEIGSHIINLNAVTNPNDNRIYIAGTNVSVTYMNAYDPVEDLWYTDLSYPGIGTGLSGISLAIDPYTQNVHLFWEYNDHVHNYAYEPGSDSWTIASSPFVVGGVDKFTACGYGTELQQSHRQKWYVSLSGSDISGDGSPSNPFETIQRAVLSADSGDSVLIGSGRFTENVHFHRDTLTITGGHVGETIVDGDNQGRCFHIDSSDIVIENISFTGGVVSGPSPNGAGVGLFHSIASIDSCDFYSNGLSTDNSAGGGIAATYSTLDIHYSKLHGNSAGDIGGGVAYIWSSGTITNCSIYDNNTNEVELRGGGGLAIWHSTLDVGGSLFHSNSAGRGGGIWIQNISSLNISNCTITGNTASVRGGGISRYDTHNNSISIDHTILWGNNSPANPDIEGGSTAIDYCIIQYPDGVGNVSSDPLFTDEYSLSDFSPAIDAGNMDFDGDGDNYHIDFDDRDPDGSRKDIGAFFFDKRLHPPDRVILFTPQGTNGWYSYNSLTWSPEVYVPQFSSYGMTASYDNESNKAIVLGTDGNHVAYDYPSNNYDSINLPGDLGNLHIASAYDIESDKLIIFGNEGPKLAYDYNTDSYEYLTGINGEGDHGMCAVYDSESDKVLLFTHHGTNGSYDYNTSTWENDVYLPELNATGLSAAYDSESDRSIIVTNQGARIAYDYNSNSYENINLPGTLGDIQLAAAYDVESDRVVILTNNDGYDVAYDYNTDSFEYLEGVHGGSSYGMSAVYVGVAATHHQSEYEGPLWHVSIEGSDITGNGSQEAPFLTIQTAMNSCTENDTILVHPGTYTSDISIQNKSVILIGVDSSSVVLNPVEFLIQSNQSDTVSLSSISIVASDNPGLILGAGCFECDSSEALSLSLESILVDGQGVARFLEGGHNSIIQISNCTFTNLNGGSTGGGVLKLESGSQSYVHINDSEFIENQSFQPGASIYASDSSSTVINRSSFIDNSSDHDGGAIFADGGTLTITKSMFQGNHGKRGGAIFTSQGASTHITNSTFDSNHASHSSQTDGGGAIGIYYSSTCIIDSATFLNNQSNTDGGAIDVNEGIASIAHSYFYMNHALNRGHAIGMDWDAEVGLDFTTLVTSSSDNGGIFMTDGSTLMISNSILWGGASSEIVIGHSSSPSTLDVEWSSLENGYLDQSENMILLWGDGNLATDPLIDPNDATGLLPTSPCIDAGNPDYDDDGNIWNVDPDDQDPDHSRFDMGAFYFDQTDSLPPTVILRPLELSEPLGTGDRVEVEWSAHDNIQLEYVLLNFSSDAGRTFTRQDSVGANEGSIHWSVPNVVADSCLLSLLVADRAGNTATDTLDTLFEIVDGTPPTIGVTLQIENHEINELDSLSLQWTASDNIGIDLYEIILHRFGDLSSVLLSAFEYPDTAGTVWINAGVVDTARIEMIATDLSGNKASAFSEYFAIRDNTHPNISHLSVMDSIAWGIGSTMDIGVIASDNVEVTGLDLNYSIDAGDTWQLIVADLYPVAGRPTYRWLIPDVPGECRIQAVVVDAVGLSDTSYSNEFEIVIQYPELIASFDRIKPNMDLPFAFNQHINLNDGISGVNVTGSVQGEYEISVEISGNEATITSEEGFVSLDTLMVVLSADHWQNSFGYGLDGNHNGTFEGSPLDNDTSYTMVSIAGDYDQNSLLDFEDFDDFVTAWRNEAPDYELYPHLGDIPHISIQPDSSFDVFDLATFASMWNWAAGVFFTAPQLESFPYGEFESVQDGNVLSVALPTGEYNSSQTIIKYDPAEVAITTTDQSLNKVSISQLSMTNEYPDSGYIIITSSQSIGEQSQELLLGLAPTTKKKYTIEVAVQGSYGQSEFVKKRGEIELLPIPTTFSLTQNYPNPFNASTTIEYGLPIQSDMSLSVYDIRGRFIREIYTGEQQAGYHFAQWNGMNDYGEVVASGLYFIVLNTPEIRIARKALILK